jgi:hypothetical protein
VDNSATTEGVAEVAALVAGVPFLTAYDPPGTSEGTLDPLGLYQVADQLAVRLVPAVRERMQRVRFLTAMTVGAIVSEGLDANPVVRDAEPYLGWEWLVVEALVRAPLEGEELWGVPGTLVGRRAVEQHGYLDARSYLKVPRVFGFNGVYKRLAVQLGLVDVHLASGPNAEGLADAWAKGMDLGKLGWRKVATRSVDGGSSARAGGETTADEDGIHGHRLGGGGSRVRAGRSAGEGEAVPPRPVARGR